MGETLDFFRGRLDSMIDLQHPLAVLGTRLPWAQIEAALTPIKAIKPAEFERIIVPITQPRTVQEKAIAYPVDSRLLEIARYKIIKAARACAIPPRQTFAKEGKTLRSKAGGYAHARQFKRLARAVKRQRTILGKLIREVRGKLAVGSVNTGVSAFTLSSLSTLLARADRIRTQKKNDKNKLYALHAPEVECIREGQSPQPL